MNVMMACYFQGYSGTASAFAAGTVSSENEDYGSATQDPNKWLVLMEYFLDPAKLKQYMQANCEEKLERCDV